MRPGSSFSRRGGAVTDGMTVERGHVRLPAEASSEDGSATCREIAVSEAAGAGGRRFDRSRPALHLGVLMASSIPGHPHAFAGGRDGEVR